MRLLHVVPTYLPATRYGGPIHSVHGLCRGLVQEGHEVHVYTTSVDGPGDSDVPLGEPVELDGVRVWYFRSRVGRRLYYAPALGRALDAQLGRFDLAHLHSVFLWPTSRAARLAQRHGVPHVLSPRGMLVRELIERRSAAVKSAWLGLIESRTLAQAAAVHFTSTRELEDARALPLALPRPFVLPNGVDLPPWALHDPAPAPPPASGSAAHVLYLGRLSWKKNLEAAVEALVGNELRLSLRGPDDEQLAPRLRELAQSLGVAERLDIGDAVRGEAKWHCLAAATLVVLPSHNENFGNVVPEAMAVGRPVVVTTGVGAREVLERAGAGLVCEPTADALRIAMLTLWRDRQARERMGAAGAVHVREHLTWRRVARSMADRYARIAARGR